MSNREVGMSDQDKIEETLQETQRIIQEEGDSVPDRLYRAIEGMSSTFLGWRHSNNKKGWSRNLVDLSGQPIYTKNQSILIENAMETLGPQIENAIQEGGFAGQRGGASLKNIKVGATSELVEVPNLISPENISLDLLFNTIMEKVSDFDQTWKDITNQLGIIKVIEATDKPIPFPPGIIPGRSVLPVLTGVIEVLRLALGNPKFDLPPIRALLSIALGFLDLLRGFWQNGLLSLIGVFGPNLVVFGFLGKVFLNVFSFVSPDLQRQLIKDLYKSGKSMFIGLLLWLFSVFAPKTLQLSINTAFDRIRDMVEQYNEKVESIEEKIQSSVSKAGIIVSFPTVPLTMVPSMDDIQNLQTMARLPEIYCSKEFEDIIAPILLVPPLRLVLELMNIPTLPQDREEECAGKEKPLSDTIADAVTPDIEIDPEGPIAKAAEAKAKVEEAAAMAQDPSALLEAATESATKKVNLPGKTLVGGSRKRKQQKQKKSKTRRNQRLRR